MNSFCMRIRFCSQNDPDVGSRHDGKEKLESVIG